MRGRVQPRSGAREPVPFPRPRGGRARACGGGPVAAEVRSGGGVCGLHFGCGGGCGGVGGGERGVVLGGQGAGAF